MREIIGNTTATPNPPSDWKQTDVTKADFIKNKPNLGALAEKDIVEKNDLAADIKASLNKISDSLPADTTLADLPDDATHRTVTDEEKASWNNKLDKTGGSVNGDITVNGDLTVKGTTRTEEHETIVVEDNMVILNSNKADLQTSVSGLAMNKNSSSTYAAVYDPADNTFKFGEGTVDGNKEFTFNEGEGLPLAVRDDSAKFTDGHLTQWSEDGNKFIDSGRTIDDIDNKAYATEVIKDSSVAYTKDIHADGELAPYAAITEIGGMSKKCTNLCQLINTVITNQGYVLTPNADGSITVTGAATTDSTVVLNFMAFGIDGACVDLKANTKYSFSNINVGSSKSIGCKIEYTDEQGGYVYGWQNQDITRERRLVQVYLQTSSSNAAVGDTSLCGTYYVWINEGDTALPYEPYFEGLRDAKVTAVESVGVNLFDKSQIVIGHALGNAGGSYTDAAFCYSEAIAVNEGISYFTANVNWCNFYTDSNAPSSANYVNQSFTNVTNEFTAPSGAKFVRLNIKLSNVDTAKLNDGTTKHTFPIPEAVQALDGYGQGISKEYHNKIVLDPAEGVKKFHAVVGEVTFDGSSDEAWSLYAGGKNVGFSIPLYKMMMNGRKNGIASYSHLVTQTSPVNSAIDGITFGTTDNRNIYITQSNAVYSTLAEWKAHLAENPLTVCYLLNSPTETDISDYISDDNLLNIEQGGTLTAVNEYGYDVPFTYELYSGQKNECFIADKFIGYLDGKASRAECDGEGNNIVDTYATKDETNNIKQTINDTIVDVDGKADLSDEVISNTVAYAVGVPTDSAKYAEITEIGGMSRKCTNLIPYPYTEKTKTYLGVTYTVSDDGSITLSGTPTGDSFICIYDGNMLSTANHTISLIGSLENAKMFVFLISADNKTLFATDATTATIDITKYSTAVRERIVINRTENGKACRGTAYVMANEGSTALPYEPYYEGLRDAKVTEVKSVGINIWDETWKVTTNDSGVEVFANATRIPVKPNTKYFYTGTANMSNALRFVDKDLKYITQIYPSANSAFTTPSNCAYINFKLAGAYGLEYKHDICINEYNEAINGTYYPYIEPKTLDIPEEVQALEGYGLGVNTNHYNYIDFDSKKFIARFGKEKLKNLSWSYRTTSAGVNTFQATVPNIKEPTNISTKALMLTPKYTPHYAYNTIGAGYNGRDKIICVYQGKICIVDNNYTDVSTFVESLGEDEFVYELSSLIETDISEYISNDNLIGVEGGGTLTAVNEYGHDTPSKITFHINNNKAVSANKFIGDLHGIASQATSLILTSPNGTRYEITVGDDGTLSAKQTT